MELRDYAKALRRYWTTWVGITLASVAVALAVVLAASPSYQATATVFVAATSSDSTDGAQFIRQRVVSYPDVARSQAVLGAVIEQGDLPLTVAGLRGRVAATNPPDSSQVDITVTDGDPETAARIANAVAEEFGSAVELLERPADGDSPVDLTVTDPARVPAGPVFPDPALLLGLGLVVGLALGIALALLRSRSDTRLHDEDDVRAAWGEDGADLSVHTGPRGGRRHSTLATRPATLVARQLAPRTDDRLVRGLFLSASPDDDSLATAFAADVAAELTDGGVPAVVTGSVTAPTGRVPKSGVQLATSTPVASLGVWRRIGRQSDGVVLVAKAGRIHRADLQEIRSILTAADARLLAVVLLPRRWSRATPVLDEQDASAPPAQPERARPAGKGTALSGR